MTDWQISCLAQIAAIQTRVAGMQAANQQRAVLGESMAYTAEDFNYEAAELARIAEMLKS
jgi:hypothetical protein